MTWLALALAAMNLTCGQNVTTFDGPPSTCEEQAQLAYCMADAAQFEDMPPDAAYENALAECPPACDYHDLLEECSR